MARPYLFCQAGFEFFDHTRYGLPLTTSSTRAAERFIEGLDLLLEQNFGPEIQFTEAIEADPGSLNL